MRDFLSQILVWWVLFLVIPSVIYDLWTYDDRSTKWEKERAAADRRG